ncbi:hypothetical protein [Francisella sp. SYW-2]|uniref:hypothetical protein n=1 Tax=Francisella sp. SYW-2 TaxID=2610886 RepID=UPI00123CA8C8|nr:hypothetical protein [Francisella sp. SYW-2]
MTSNYKNAKALLEKSTSLSLLDYEAKTNIKKMIKGCDNLGIFFYDIKNIYEEMFNDKKEYIKNISLLHCISKSSKTHMTSVDIRHLEDYLLSFKNEYIRTYNEYYQPDGLKHLSGSLIERYFVDINKKFNTNIKLID